MFKMITFFLKSQIFFILKNNSPPVCRSPVSFLLSLHRFSTSGESQPHIHRKVFDILLHRHDFPPELASRIASDLTHLKNTENVNSILSFFKENGFSNTQLEKILKYEPRFLSANLEDIIKPKIKIFQDLGLPSDDISRLISGNPSLLRSSSVNYIIPSLSTLKDLLGSKIELGRVIRRSPWILNSNMENTVVPNVEFLKSCGIPMERIRIVLRDYPSSFRVKPEIMRKSAEKAKEMGLKESSKMFVYAIQTMVSMSNEAWELKLKAFKDLGFSESDILIMFRKAPMVFLVSREKIKKIKDVLLATGKFNMSCIVNYPMSLKLSVEKRYLIIQGLVGIQ